MPDLHLTTDSVNKIELAPQGQILYRDPKLQGFGLRVGTKSKAYFAEKRVDGRTVRVTLGLHGQITTAQARQAAQENLGKMAGGIDLNAKKKAEAVQRAAAVADEEARTEHTLGKLCEVYVGWLKSNARPSAPEVANIFKNHVATTEFWNLPAKELTPKQATAIFRRLVEADKGRTAAMTRAYLRSAYAMAVGAETNADAPSAFLLMGIEQNPIAATGALSKHSKTRNVVLTEAELGEYVRLLRKEREAGLSLPAAVAELSLLLGGQRTEQVVRAKAVDVRLDEKIIVLLDPKGRRLVPRRHALPLTPRALELVEEILKVRQGAWLFGHGTTCTTSDTVSDKGNQLMKQVRANLAAKARAAGRAHPPEHEIQLRDVRRTAETMLAGMGIAKEVRAQLQSHGLGGVQDRHYDMHTYMPEKLQALMAWDKRLQQLADNQPAPSNVLPLRAA